LGGKLYFIWVPTALFFLIYLIDKSAYTFNIDEQPKEFSHFCEVIVVSFPSWVPLLVSVLLGAFIGVGRRPTKRKKLIYINESQPPISEQSLLFVLEYK